MRIAACFFEGRRNRSDADTEAVAVMFMDQGVGVRGIRGPHGGRVPLDPFLSRSQVAHLLLPR